MRRRPELRLRRAALGAAVLATALSGCGRGTVAGTPEPAAACVIGGAAASDSVRVALRAAVDPAHAPVPRNEAERIVFRQLYETLVRVDCADQLLPALAESWSSNDNGSVWQLRLRQDATFWDGTRLTARDVVDSWSSAPVPARAAREFARLEVIGDRELRIELREPSADARVFAHADLAIAKRVAGSDWPGGSGPYRPAEAPGPRALRVVRRDARATAQTIVFAMFPSSDARAPLDARVDVYGTDDPTAVEYARALQGYSVAPLPWNRTYVLATRVRPAAEDTLMGPSSDVLDALAHDAVRAGTRSVQPPLPWQDPACDTVRWSLIQAPPRGRAFGYVRGDPIARSIAERLVALAWPPTRAPGWLRGLMPADYANGTAPTAVALDPGAFDDALRTGSALAFVLPLPRSAAARCDAVADPVLTSLRARGWRVTPLLDARPFLLHRATLPHVLLEAGGVPFFGTVR